MPLITTGKLLRFLDRNLIELAAGFLLVFLPLYPKWPLLDILPGYIVRLRLDDIIVVAVFVLFLLQVLRRKVQVRKNPLLVPIAFYLLVGLVSSFSAMFITRTVPLE